jgi:pyridoxamine 5'-phosphate oxidase
MTSLAITQLDSDPSRQFADWHRQWAASAPPDANAMVLATVDANGQPWVRTVLLKACDERGFVFFTNRESNKGEQLAANTRAALHFLWLPASSGGIARQVQVQGVVERTGTYEDDAYFASRPRESQLGAWASQQSRPLDSRETLLDRFVAAEMKYAGGAVPRPSYWGGYRLVPERIEFWQGGAHRLHDRFVYQRLDEHWVVSRLNP